MKFKVSLSSATEMRIIQERIEHLTMLMTEAEVLRQQKCYDESIALNMVKSSATPSFDFVASIIDILSVEDKVWQQRRWTRKRT